jgi:hypothetical protein
MVLAVAVAGCGGGSKPAASVAATATHEVKATKTPPPDDNAQLQRLLLDRSRAIQDGDAARLAATSTGAQQARDRREAKAASLLPLDSVELESSSSNLGKNTATMHVYMRYSFSGVDDQYGVRSSMRFTKTPQGWRVASDEPAGIEAPWQRGTFIAHRSKHFLALTPKGLKLSGFMNDLEAGRAKMKRALPGVKAPARLLVVVARTDGDTNALTRNVRALSTLDAMAEASTRMSGPARRVTLIAGQRLLVPWRSFGRLSRGERRMTIAHEVTHASLARHTSGRTPIWLIEGMAMYVSGDKRYGDAGALLSGAFLRDHKQQVAAKRVLSLTALGKPTSMVRLTAVPLAFAYSYSAAAAFAIADKHGRQGLLKLYLGFNSAKIKGRPGRELMDRVMRTTLHESFSQVEDEVKAYAAARPSV